MKAIRDKIERQFGKQDSPKFYDAIRINTCPNSYSILH